MSAAAIRVLTVAESTPPPAPPPDPVIVIVVPTVPTETVPAPAIVKSPVAELTELTPLVIDAKETNLKLTKHYGLSH